MGGSGHLVGPTPHQVAQGRGLRGASISTKYVDSSNMKYTLAIEVWEIPTCMWLSLFTLAAHYRAWRLVRCVKPLRGAISC